VHLNKSEVLGTKQSSNKTKVWLMQRETSVLYSCTPQNLVQIKFKPQICY